VVYNGVQLPELDARVVRAPRSVLAIASPDPRKNLVCLYDALSRHSAMFGPAGAPRLEIVCTHAGAAQRAEAELKMRGAANYNLLLGLDDVALARAYAGATVFAFPSLREGFGLPPVEAMTMGTPVVASSAEPMPEVLGDAALFFPPESPESLARSLAQILNDPNEQLRRSELGRAWAARYTARAQAEGTAAAWSAARCG
jgi:glycosyltransferase involved in cell wall biosynthesis